MNTTAVEVSIDVIATSLTRAPGLPGGRAARPVIARHNEKTTPRVEHDAA